MAEQTLTLNCIKSAFVDSTDSTTKNTNYHGAASYNPYWYRGGKVKYLLLGFTPFSQVFPSQYTKNALYEWKFKFTGQVSKVDALGIDFYVGDAPDFDENTVTYEDVWQELSSGGIQVQPDSTSIEDQYITVDSSSVDFYASRSTFFIHGFYSSYKSSYSSKVYTQYASSAYRPVITVTYDDSVVATSKVVGYSPKSGYVDPTTAVTFDWYLTGNPYYSIDDFVQTSATFMWSSDGGSTWNNVSVSGSNEDVTLAANTLPRGTIQWKVTATDDRGATTTSPTYTISTADELITATPIAPSGSVEDGDSEIAFRWNNNSPSGTEPLSSRIFYKLLTDANWSYVNISGTATSYTMPSGTLSSGTYTWGVLVQNQAGNWSSEHPNVEFICVAAPATPSVTVTAVPFATINWQSTGQQAYRITVDGRVYGPFFGTVKQFQLPDYLSNGQHTVAVEIQGQYGLWSNAGTETFTVQNVSGSAVTLTGDFDRDAVLNWTTSSSSADYLIYRDGVKIGHTAYKTFSDRTVLGEHSWQVINRLANGNYTASNIVSGTLKSCVTAISPLEGGDWMELPLSENSDSSQTFSWERTMSLRHVAGAVYPVLEMSAFEDGTGTYDVSFPDVESGALLEQLKGRVVIVKSRGGNVLIGCLSSLQKRTQDFYISYGFTISRIHWEDYIDDSGS